MHLKEEKKLYKQNIQSNNERIRERRRNINLRVKKERKKITNIYREPLLLITPD